MARTVVTVRRAGIEEILHGEGSGGHVHRYLRAKARETQRHARRLSPKRTGALRASIRALEPVDAPRRVRISIVVGVRYGLYQELGTGVYAGRGPITAPTSRGKLAYRFKPSNPALARDGKRIGRRGGFITVRSYKGTPAIHYMATALELTCADTRLRLRYVRR